MNKSKQVTIAGQQSSRPASSSIEKTATAKRKQTEAQRLKEMSARMEKLLTVLEVQAGAIGDRLTAKLADSSGGSSDWEREVRAMSGLTRTFEKLVGLSSALARDARENVVAIRNESGSKKERTDAIRQEILRRLDRLTPPGNT